MSKTMATQTSNGVAVDTLKMTNCAAFMFMNDDIHKRAKESLNVVAKEAMKDKQQKAAMAFLQARVMLENLRVMFEKKDKMVMLKYVEESIEKDYLSALTMFATAYNPVSIEFMSIDDDDTDLKKTMKMSIEHLFMVLKSVGLRKGEEKATLFIA